MQDHRALVCNNPFEETTASLFFIFFHITIRIVLAAKSHTRYNIVACLKHELVYYFSWILLGPAVGG